MADTDPTPGNVPTASDTTPTGTPTVSQSQTTDEWPAVFTPFTVSSVDQALTTPYVWPKPHCPTWRKIQYLYDAGPGYMEDLEDTIYAGHEEESGHPAWGYRNRNNYDQNYCLPDIAKSIYNPEDHYDFIGRPDRWYGGQNATSNNTTGAVCPQNWVALEMGVSSSVTREGRSYIWSTWSTAFCCPSSYNIFPAMRTMNMVAFNQLDLACVSSFTASTEVTKYDVLTTDSSGSLKVQASHSLGLSLDLNGVHHEVTFTVSKVRESSGPNQNLISTIFTLPYNTYTMEYQPFPISWDASQINTLSPEPPTLTSNMRIPTWTAGMQRHEWNSYDRPPDNPGTRASIDEQEAEWRAEDAAERKKFLSIVIPISVIGGILLVLSVWRFWVLMKRKRTDPFPGTDYTERKIDHMRTFFGLKRKEEITKFYDLDVPLEVLTPEGERPQDRQATADRLA